MSDEARRIEALHRLELLDTPDDADYDRIVHLASTMLDAPIALINLIDVDRQWSKARVGTDVVEHDRMLSICTYIVDEASTEPLVIDDIVTDPRFTDHPLVTSGADIHAYLGKGLQASGGEIVGTLCVVDRRPRHWTEQDRRAITDIAVFAEQLLVRPDINNIAQALQRSEDRKSVLLATMHDGVVIQDTHGRIVQWNPAAERVLGLTANELSGRTSIDPRWAAAYPDGTPWHGDTHPAMEALASGQPVRESVMSVQRPDASFVLLRISSTPTTENGEVTGVLTTFTDITHTIVQAAVKPLIIEQTDMHDVITVLRPHLEHFAATMTNVRTTLEFEVAVIRGMLDELTITQDLVAVVAARPMSDVRDQLTSSIVQLEEARRLARAHLFDALHKHGISIGEIARMWGISRQLASRIIRDINLNPNDATILRDANNFSPSGS